MNFQTESLPQSLLITPCSWLLLSWSQALKDTMCKRRESLLYPLCPNLLFPLSFASQTEIGLPNLPVHWDLSPCPHCLLGPWWGVREDVSLAYSSPAESSITSCAISKSRSQYNVLWTCDESRWLIVSPNHWKGKCGKLSFIGSQWPDHLESKRFVCTLSFKIFHGIWTLATVGPLRALHVAGLFVLLGHLHVLENKWSGRLQHRWFWQRWPKRKLWKIWGRELNSVKKLLQREVPFGFSYFN